MKMTFYRGNKVDGEFTADVTEVAQAFWQSRQAGYVLDGGMMLDRALRDFLTDPEGWNSSWEDGAAYADLHMLVRGSWPREGGSS